MRPDRRFHWVMANRAPRGAIGQIGAMVGGLVDGALTRDSERRVQLASVLADCGDQEFRRHCRMGELHEGVLAIEVDEPGLIGVMRTRWASIIESALRKGGAKTGARRVLFKFGRNGDRFLMDAGGMSDRHG